MEILTAEKFKPFGDVIETSSAKDIKSINYGFTQRHHDLAKIDTLVDGGKTIVNIFRSKPPELPFNVKLLERHPKSSQAFIPLGSEPYLVIVAPKGDLDETKIRVFLASANQGVNYHAGTWHHYSLALNKVSDFLVIDRDAEDQNCDEVNLKSPFNITVEDVRSLL